MEYSGCRDRVNPPRSARADRRGEGWGSRADVAAEGRFAADAARAAAERVGDAADELASHVIDDAELPLHGAELSQKTRTHLTSIKFTSIDFCVYAQKLILVNSLKTKLKMANLKC